MGERKQEIEYFEKQKSGAEIELDYLKKKKNALKIEWLQNKLQSKRVLLLTLHNISYCRQMMTE